MTMVSADMRGIFFILNEEGIMLKLFILLLKATRFTVGFAILTPERPISPLIALRMLTEADTLPVEARDDAFSGSRELMESGRLSRVRDTILTESALMQSLGNVDHKV